MANGDQLMDWVLGVSQPAASDSGREERRYEVFSEEKGMNAGTTSLAAERGADLLLKLWGRGSTARLQGSSMLLSALQPSL